MRHIHVKISEIEEIHSAMIVCNLSIYRKRPFLSTLRLRPFLIFVVSKMSLVDFGKRLLEAAKRGDTDEVRTLMSNGAPFTTDWVSFVS